MGGANSKGKLGASASSASLPQSFVGLENFGNTCYANSVVQFLYWCEPFRYD